MEGLAEPAMCYLGVSNHESQNEEEVIDHVCCSPQRLLFS